MRKISVGSFPLVDINPANRKYVESYLINTLADLISINQISASIYDDRAKFITPTVIVDYFKNNKNNLNLDKNYEMQKNASIDYREDKAYSIRNAFKNTKNLYRSISNDPFFKNHIFYPIYIEEKIKGQNGYTDYKYDFLILSNDLIKQQMLDEITYDDKITMLFLVLKDILFPYNKLTELGVRDNNFRKYFSIYLETCKNENTNPFDLFVKIIKFAGNQRLNGNQSISSRGLFNRITSQGPSKAFTNLFNNSGEIKDVTELLRFTQSEIATFLNDNTAQNKVDISTFNPIARQYAQAKTHEYSKILSIIDSLVQFNKQIETSEEINDNQMIRKLIDSDGKDLPINIDSLLNDLEIIYFKSFLDSLVNIDNQIINMMVRNLRNIKDNNGNPIDLFGVDSEDLYRKIELIKDELINNAREKSFAEESFQKIKDALANQFNPTNYTSNDLVNTKQKIDAFNATSNQLNSMLGSLQAQTMQYKQISEADRVKIRNDIVKADNGMDFELYKSHLTALYGELYTYFYSDDFQKDITNKNNQTIHSLNDLNSSLITQIKISINELSSIFKKYYIDKFQIYFRNNVFTLPNANNRFNQNKRDEVLKSIETTFDNDFKFESIILNTIFIPVFKKYGNSTIMEAQRIKNLRTEKNPLIRKLLSDTGLFKAFIINEETILGVYDILHYLDTLKYEVGLINNPVSQVNNKINKINFIINRLGLNQNPVFVINQSEITLSMPNHLSLTGKNFINRISKSDFLKVANISFDKNLWSQNGMFGTGSDNIFVQKKKIDLDRINTEINEANKTLKEAQSRKDKDAINKAKQQLNQAQSRQRKAQEEYENVRNSSNDTTTLSGNINPRVRDDYQRTWRQDGPNGPYNSNMDNNGLRNYENNNVINIRNNMQDLSNQNYNQNGRFLQNPYIQQRYNELNRGPQQNYNPQGNTNLGEY